MQNPIRVDPLSLTSLRVVPKFNEIELASATAFTTYWDEEPYLITNWHVVAGRNADTNKCLDESAAIPNALSVRFHAQAKLGAWNTVKLPLVDEDGAKLWLEHPLGKLIDVVAIPIRGVGGVDIFPLDLKLADVDILAMPAMRVTVVGYPLGLSAGESWPIWKTGHIASDPDIDFQPGRPAFLIDATTRVGMSGAPVVLRSTNYQEKSGDQVLGVGVTTRFMGVYAGRIHGESEIGRVWRPFVLSELFLRRLLFNETTRRKLPGRLANCPCDSGKRFKECCGGAL